MAPLDFFRHFLSLQKMDGFNPFFCKKNDLMQENRKQLCWDLMRMVGKPSGASLEQTGLSHEFIGTLGNSQGGPGHLEAQPPRWCFSSQRGGKSWRSQVDVTESPTYFDVGVFFWMFSVVGERKSWKRKGVGSSTLLEWRNFPLRRFTVELVLENPLRICGTALLGTCRFANPHLYSCGNAPAKNGLFWCWLRWVFSCRDGSGETFFITFCWLIVVQGGFLLIHPGRLTWNIIMEVWKIIFLSKWLISRFHVNLPGCTVDTGHLKTRFLILHLAVIQSWAHFPCLPGPLPPLAWHATCFHVQECWFWTQLFSAHGKEKIRKCGFIFCATSITGQLETQQDEMWWDFLGCSEF